MISMKKALIILGISLAVIVTGLLVVLMLLTSDQPKPPDPVTKEVIVDIPVSTFNVPVRLKIETLAGYLNRKITGTFLEKNLFLQSSRNEEVRLTLTRKEDLTISSDGKMLVCKLPLDVKVTLLKSRLGKTVTGWFKPVHTSLLVTVSTPVSLDENWSLVTDFKITGYRWTKEPLLHIGPFTIQLTKLLNKEIGKKNELFTRVLNREINKEVSLKPTVSDVWKSLQKPVTIARNPAEIWLRFLCRDIQGRIQLSQSDITCFTSLQAKTLVVTDTAETADLKQLPDFSRLPETDKTTQSNIYLYAYTTFDEINEQLTGYFQGKTFSARGRTIKIKHIRAYASTQGLTIAVETDKAFKGSLFMSGELLFDLAGQRLKVQNFDYAIDSKNTLIKTGDELLHARIKKAVASKLHVDLDTLISKVPALLHDAIASGKAGKAITLSVEKPEIRHCDILLGEKRIHMVLHVLAETDLEIKRIKTGRKINISDTGKPYPVPADHAIKKPLWQRLSSRSIKQQLNTGNGVSAFLHAALPDLL